LTKSNNSDNILKLNEINRSFRQRVRFARAAENTAFGGCGEASYKKFVSKGFPKLEVYHGERIKGLFDQRGRKKLIP
jgi:hypothetical protein